LCVFLLLLTAFVCHLIKGLLTYLLTYSAGMSTCFRRVLPTIVTSNINSSQLQCRREMPLKSIKYSVSQKTSPTFLAVTPVSIVGFS